MKRTLRILTLILTAVLFFSSTPCVAMAEEELSAKDMFYSDFSLNEQNLALILEDCQYDPNNKYPYGYNLFVTYQYIVPDGGNPDKYYTVEEAHDYYCKMIGIKKEYFNKYLIRSLDAAYIERDSKGQIIKYGFAIAPNDTLVKELEAFDSYEKAEFYAKLYLILTVNVPDKPYGTFEYYSHYYTKIPNTQYGSIAAPEDDGLSARGLLYMDYNLFEEIEVAGLLELCQYNPNNNNPFGYDLFVTYKYDGYGQKYYTVEEIHEYYCRMLWINEAHFEKYLVRSLDDAYIEKDDKGQIITYGFTIAPNDTLIKEVETFDSFEKAYFYAGLYGVISLDLYGGALRSQYHSCIKIPSAQYSTSAANRLPFDLNYDGSINSRDVLMLKRAIAGHEVKCNYYTRDLNGDGVTNAKDMLYLNTFAKMGIDLRK